MAINYATFSVDLNKYVLRSIKIHNDTELWIAVEIRKLKLV